MSSLLWFLISRNIFVLDSILKNILVATPTRTSEMQRQQQRTDLPRLLVSIFWFISLSLTRSLYPSISISFLRLFASVSKAIASRSGNK